MNAIDFAKHQEAMQRRRELIELASSADPAQLELRYRWEGLSKLRAAVRACSTNDVLAVMDEIGEVQTAMLIRFLAK